MFHSYLRLECVSHDEGSGDDDDELMNPVLTPDSKTKGSPNFLTSIFMSTYGICSPHLFKRYIYLYLQVVDQCC